MAQVEAKGHMQDVAMSGYYSSSGGDTDNEEYSGDDEWQGNKDADIQERVKAAQIYIQDTKNFLIKEYLDSLISHHGAILSAKDGRDDRNFLHFLVDGVKHHHLVPEQLEPLAQFLVLKYPRLLVQPDKNKDNPVMKAIRQSEHQLLRSIISACYEVTVTPGKEHPEPASRYFAEALEMKDKEGKLSLHLALDRDICSYDHETAKVLVKHTPVKELSWKDTAGNTPMHYAVSPPECTNQTVELVELFLKRDLAAKSKLPTGKDNTTTFLDIDITSVDDKQRSIYRKHIESRKTAREGTQTGINKLDTGSKKKRKKSRANGLAADSLLDNNNISNNNNPMDASLIAVPTTQTNSNLGSWENQYYSRVSYVGRVTNGGGGDLEDEREQKRRHMQQRELEHLSGNNLKNNGEPKASNPRGLAIEVRPPVPSEKTDGQQTTPQAAGPQSPMNISRTIQRRDTGNSVVGSGHGPLDDGWRIRASKKRKVAPESSREDRESSEKIKLLLKLHYMRTRTAEMATAFLYGTKSDDTQITLDFTSIGSRVSWERFENLWGAKPEDGSSKATSTGTPAADSSTTMSTGSLKLDTVLQYVRFPRLVVEVTGPTADQERKDVQKGASTAPLGCYGRRDVQMLLDWLYKRGVTHIIKLSVDDLEDETGQSTVHGDEMIQEAVDKFHIEQLDWSKTDLDTETILLVSCDAGTGRKKKLVAPAPAETTTTKQDQKAQKPRRDIPATLAGLEAYSQLRELELKWSGSNSVLRAWSELEGLPLLPRLQRIHIVGPLPSKLYDSPEWVKQKLQEFCERFDKHRQHICDSRKKHKTEGSEAKSLDNKDELYQPVKITTSQIKAVPTQTASSSTTYFRQLNVPGMHKGQAQDRWLTAADKFAKAMKPFWTNTLSVSGEQSVKLRKLKEDVVVALIDDGVNVLDEAFGDFEEQEKPFLPGKSVDYHFGKKEEWFCSARGHGTIMASMILRMCPMAKIYPIRLKTYPAPGNRWTIDRQYAAKAIRAALDKGAHIISMSWTLPMLEGKDEETDKELKEVLSEAERKKVLVFCSAPDDGKVISKHYPSGGWSKDFRFLCIGASDAHGSVFRATQDDGVCYILPGVHVDINNQGPRSFDVDGEPGELSGSITYETGSSVATALAAGLAAMILYCVKATLITIDLHGRASYGRLSYSVSEDAPAKLAQDSKAMREAFAKLGMVTGEKFIQIWDTMNQVSTELEKLQPGSAQLSEVERQSIFLKFIEFGVRLAGVVS